MTIDFRPWEMGTWEDGEILEVVTGQVNGFLRKSSNNHNKND